MNPYVQVHGHVRLQVLRRIKNTLSYIYRCTYKLDEAEDYYMSLYALTQRNSKHCLNLMRKLYAQNPSQKPTAPSTRSLPSRILQLFFCVTGTAWGLLCQYNVELIHSTRSCDARPEALSPLLADTDLGWVPDQEVECDWSRHQ